MVEVKRVEEVLDVLTLLLAAVLALFAARVQNLPDAHAELVAGHGLVAVAVHRACDVAHLELVLDDDAPDARGERLKRGAVLVGHRLIQLLLSGPAQLLRPPEPPKPGIALLGLAQSLQELVGARTRARRSSCAAAPVVAASASDRPPSLEGARGGTVGGHLEVELLEPLLRARPARRAAASGVAQREGSLEARALGGAVELRARSPWRGLDRHVHLAVLLPSGPPERLDAL